MEKFHFDFRPNVIITDYETGLISSLKAHLPDTQHRNGFVARLLICGMYTTGLEI